MAAYWRITKARVLDDHAIQVRFTDGLEGVVRFSPDFFQGVFSHLCDPVKFRELAVVDGAVTWPGGLDLAPDAMYQEIKLHGEQIAAKHMLPLPLRERVGERGCEQQYSKQAYPHYRRAERCRENHIRP